MIIKSHLSFKKQGENKMIENIASIVTIASMLLFVYVLLWWLKTAKRANKVIDEFEKNNNEDSEKCDYSTSEKWLDKNMD